MIEHLATVDGTHLDVSSHCPASKRATARDLLRQKIEVLRQQAIELESHTDQFEGDQKKLHGIVTGISKDHQDIEQQQDALKALQQNLDVGTLQIKKGHIQIQLCVVDLSAQWKNLLYQALELQTSHRRLHMQLNKTEEKSHNIDQCAVLINQNIPLIKYHHQNAIIKIENIQVQVVKIKDNHQAIKVCIEGIEEMKDHIQDHIPKLQKQQKAKLAFFGKEGKIGYMFAWLKRIQEFCLWIFATVCHVITQVHRCIQSWDISAGFSENQPDVNSLISKVSLNFLPATAETL